jgi:hypothetical protein
VGANCGCLLESTLGGGYGGRGEEEGGHRAESHRGRGM